MRQYDEDNPENENREDVKTLEKWLKHQKKLKKLSKRLIPAKTMAEILADYGQKV